MAISYYDPTDHHPTLAPTERPPYATADALIEARMQQGICSTPGCARLIDGWCVGCRAKLCERHLHDHHNQHTREYLRAQAAQMADDPGELAAHVRDDAGAVDDLDGVDLSARTWQCKASQHEECSGFFFSAPEEYMGETWFPCCCDCHKPAESEA